MTRPTQRDTFTSICKVSIESRLATGLQLGEYLVGSDIITRDVLAERHARVDDLSVLVELIAAGFERVDARLEAIERKLDGGQVVDLPLAS